MHLMKLVTPLFYSECNCNYYSHTPTTVVGARHLCFCVCVRVCLHDKTKTAETTIIKLATLTQQLMLGQKVEVTGTQKSQSAKTY